MNGWHARGFILLGWLLWSAPAWWPDYFPAGPIDGYNTSALWLAVMGLLNGLLGAVGVLRFDVAPGLARVLTALVGGLGDFGPELFCAPYRTMSDWSDYERWLTAPVEELEPVRV